MAGNDGSVPEGAEYFVDVVDDRFDRAISHVGHNRLVDRGHMKDVKGLAGFVHWSYHILTGRGLLPLDLLANRERTMPGSGDTVCRLGRQQGVVRRGVLRTM